MTLQYLDRLDSLRLSRREVYEPWETSIVKRDLKSGQVFVDVGAHIGYYTIMAAGIVGPEGRVFAFEPEPENFAVLEKNVVAADAQNVMIANIAVSSQNGVSSLFLNPKSTGDNRVGVRQAGWKELMVDTVSLDHYFSDYDGRMDFIKIDAQGHEIAILAGALKMIERFRMLKMLIEYAPALLAMSGYEPSLLLRVLRNHGFSISSSRTHSHEKCTIENRRHCNIFCERSKTSKI